VLKNNKCYLSIILSTHVITLIFKLKYENIFAVTKAIFLPNEPTKSRQPDCTLYIPTKCRLRLIPLQAPSQSSSSLHGLGKSPVPASSIAVSLHHLLGLSMSRFPDVWYLYACCGIRVCSILCRCASHLFLYYIISRLKVKCPTHFLYLRFLSDLI
jgi:hypothetical protein